MHIHILGICGTFMAGLAVLAKQQGHHVTGSDAKVYPPMSTQLEEQGIVLHEGYEPKHLQAAPDLVIIGNALSRGNPAVEYVLNAGLPYVSGPEWLADHVLAKRWVLAVAGTHGKTTTSSMLAWILEVTGKHPGFLIGGVPENFGVSARLGLSPFFVIEADEYDSAFFDKRSKFLHYHPKTLILNNLEFDHADIFPDLAAIQQQFHYLIRTVPSEGLLIAPQNDPALSKVFSLGCWTPISYFGSKSEWRAESLVADGSQFEVFHHNKSVGTVTWSLLGQHNIHNALAALAAAHHIGIDPQEAITALPVFQNVKRRLEVKAEVNGITLYDDFAHHPTAIQTTLQGLRAKVRQDRILVVLELASNTMKMGVHKATLGSALHEANHVFLLQPQNEELISNCPVPLITRNNIQDLINAICQEARTADHIVIMSNKSFDGIHEKLQRALS